MGAAKPRHSNRTATGLNNWPVKASARDTVGGRTAEIFIDLSFEDQPSDLGRSRVSWPLRGS